jgi:trigger factor
MRATTQELENHQVKLRIEVDAADADPILNDIKKAMAKEARLQGFRPGKVPVKVLEARMGGAAALRMEAIREALPQFYSRGVVEAGIDPVDTAELDFGEDLGSDPIVFEATVTVRPVARISSLDGIQAVVPSPLVSDDEVEAQVTRQLQADGTLVEVDRPIIAGDFITMALSATVEGEEPTTIGEDMSYEVGSGQLMPEIDEHLLAKRAGDTVSFTATPEMTGVEMVWTATVNAVKERVLPELTDAWVEENTEHVTVGEWRDAIHAQLEPMKKVQAQFAFGESIQRAIAELVDDDLVLEPMTNAELSDRIQNFNRQLERQGIGVEMYTRMMGMTTEQLIEQLRADAQVGVKIDLALRAVAVLKDLTPNEADLDAEIEDSADRLGVPAETLRSNIDQAGRMVEFAGEVAKSRAMEWLMDNLPVVDEHGIPVDRALLKQNQAEHDHDHHDHDHDHDHGGDA